MKRLDESLPLSKGTTILKAQPFAYTLYTAYRLERCDYCFAEGATLLRCSACQYVHYCGKSCQKKAWYMHKFECRHMKKFSLTEIPHEVLLAARVIIKLEHGGAMEFENVTPRWIRTFAELMSHYEDIKKDKKRMANFTKLCEMLSHFFGGEQLPSISELLTIYGKISINSFSIVDEYMNSLGYGLYLNASILDHSCKPNAIATFEGTTITVRIIEDLPHLDWSQIRVSYIDVLQATKVRRTELQETYYFWCTCEKCEKQDDLEDAMACANKSCTYPCSPGAKCCNECHTVFSEDAEERFDEVSEFTAAKVKEMDKMAYLDVCKVCLSKQKGVLHPFNLLHVQTLDLAITSAVKLKQYDEAVRYAKELLPCFLYYLGEIHPLTGLLYYTLARIQLPKNKFGPGLDNLRKAYKILTITHGKQNALFDKTLLSVLNLGTVTNTLNVPLP